MKVFHVLNSYLPDHIAGTEVYVSALARELKKNNINSKVIIPNYNNWENESYFFEGIEVIKYAEPTIADRGIITGHKAPGGLPNFLKILKIEKPDILHFHELAGSIGIGIFHVEAARNMGFKIIISFHLAKYSCKTGTLTYLNKTECDGNIKELKCSNCWLNEMGENIAKSLLIKASYTFMYYIKIDTRFLENSLGTALAFPKIIAEIKENILRLQRITDGFIVLTDWYQKVLLNNGVKQSHLTLIKQGLPNNLLETNIIIKKSNKLKLVFIGRISHFKGVDLLLSALKFISQSHVELYIYGAATDPDYMNKCLELAAGMKNIFWEGRIEPSLVINTIHKYDVLCLPSNVCEMSPLVIQEAFAAGTPVLASNVYGNAEQIIDGENGWLFKFKDVSDLKNKIEYLVAKPALIDNARLKIKAVKSFKTIAEEHIFLYEKNLLK